MVWSALTLVVGLSRWCSVREREPGAAGSWSGLHLQPGECQRQCEFCEQHQHGTVMLRC